MIRRMLKMVALITLFAGTALTAQTANAWWGGGPWNWFDDDYGWGGPWGGYPGYGYPYGGGYGYPYGGGYGYPYGGGYGYPYGGGYGYPYGGGYGYPAYAPPAAPVAPSTENK